MKIFSWMQSKLNGNRRSCKPSICPAKHHLMHETYKEEFSDWPSGLLAIGTFGNNNLKEKEKPNSPGDECPSKERPEEMSHEELRELHKELNLLLNKQSSPDSDLAEESKHNLPPGKFFDLLQSLEDDRSSSGLISDSFTSDSSVQSKEKDIHLDKRKNISKRSLSFLLRKTFHRTGKVKFSPLLKDLLPELKLEKSRLEKILRAIINKKIYPQTSTPKTPIKKCLDNKHQSETDREDEMLESTSEGSKWVKTDSDFIVLEI